MPFGRAGRAADRLFSHFKRFLNHEGIPARPEIGENTPDECR